MQAAVVPPKTVPVTVFVSRKLRKLFVRQGFTPLFDSPVKIRDPEQSLGTHVLTVMGPRNEGGRLRWTVVSMPEKSPVTPSKPRVHGKPIVETAPPAPSLDKANAALDRIELPEGVSERISALLTPGSSFIISDYAISGETGKGTDFIVVMK
jgi:hypothetical protein